MSHCRKLEKELEKGRFGENLTELPNEMTAHIKECDHCRQLFELLQSTEQELLVMEPVTPDAKARARIRVGVEKATASGKARSLFPAWMKPAFGVGFAAIMTFIVLTRLPGTMGPELTPGTGTPGGSGLISEAVINQELISNLDDSVYTEIIDLTEPGIYDSYEESDWLESETAFASIMSTDSIDESVLGTARGFLSESSTDVYNGDLIEALAELDESEWQDLRRYLS